MPKRFDRVQERADDRLILELYELQNVFANGVRQALDKLHGQLWGPQAEISVLSDLRGVLDRCDKPGGRPAWFWRLCGVQGLDDVNEDYPVDTRNMVFTVTPDPKTKSVHIDCRYRPGDYLRGL